MSDKPSKAQEDATPESSDLETLYASTLYRLGELMAAEKGQTAERMEVLLKGILSVLSLK